MLPEIDPLTAGFTLLVGCALAFLATALCTRGPEDTTVVACLRLLCRVYARVFHSLKVVCPSENPLPEKGPAIVVANHRSSVDPVIVAVATRRRVFFLMAREYYESKGLRWIFRLLGCIPVNRDGNDLGATKAALKTLQAGKVIGIFPQGGIRDAESSIEGKGGAALLALRTGAPVVPVFIDGTPNLDSVVRGLVTPSKTTLVIGPMLKLDGGPERKPPREQVERLTASILGAIEALGRSQSQDREQPAAGFDRGGTAR
ncbi:MAG: 1-acyl-sn-glycerol-3-phosphate acyltransferase [Planctomycetes bacterium]|nr:1-acyl-sn-glycerol-3-phosphate acyltransferase [Planctomycetota bacterium]